MIVHGAAVALLDVAFATQTAAASERDTVVTFPPGMTPEQIVAGATFVILSLATRIAKDADLPTEAVLKATRATLERGER